MLTPRQAAARLGIGRRTIGRYMAEGKIRVVRLGHRTLRIPVSEVEMMKAKARSEVVARALAAGYADVPHLLMAVKSLGGMALAPEKVLARIPSDLHGQLAKDLETALPWFNRFVELWEARK